MIEKDKFLNLNILKKEDYTGSMDGMRYRLVKEEEEEKKYIRVTVWPEPFCFDKTPEEKKTSIRVDFSEEGKEEAADWLNRQWVTMKQSS